MRQIWLCISFALALAVSAIPQVAAQSGAAPPRQPAGQAAAAGQQPAATCTGDDRFASLGCVKDQLNANYHKIDDDSLAEIDTLMKQKKCNINRVEGLLSRVTDAMNLWFDAEMKYWDAWELAENDRVAGQLKTLASIKEDQASAQAILNSAVTDREELQRKKAVLEATPKQTIDIRKAIDQLVQDLQGTEAQIVDAQKNFDDATVKFTNAKIALDARLIEIRQNARRIRAWKEDQVSYYDTIHASADSMCAVTRPQNSKPLPPVKGKPQ
jgi:chromosome segregation ATPase